MTTYTRLGAIALAGALVLTAASCSSSEGPSDPPTSSAPSPSTSSPSTTDEQPTPSAPASGAPSPSVAAGLQDFCNAHERFRAAADEFEATTAREARVHLEAEREALYSAEAPASLADDWQVFRDFIDGSLAAIEGVGPDDAAAYAKAVQDFEAGFGIDTLGPPSDVIWDFAVENCGF